jgi:hypothetical protein
MRAISRILSVLRRNISVLPWLLLAACASAEVSSAAREREQVAAHEPNDLLPPLVRPLRIVDPGMYPQPPFSSEEWRDWGLPRQAGLYDQPPTYDLGPSSIEGALALLEPPDAATPDQRPRGSASAAASATGVLLTLELRAEPGRYALFLERDPTACSALSVTPPQDLGDPFRLEVFLEAPDELELLRLGTLTVDEGGRARAEVELPSRFAPEGVASLAGRPLLVLRAPEGDEAPAAVACGAFALSRADPFAWTGPTYRSPYARPEEEKDQ